MCAGVAARLVIDLQRKFLEHHVLDAMGKFTCNIGFNMKLSGAPQTPQDFEDHLLQHEGCKLWREQDYSWLFT